MKESVKNEIRKYKGDLFLQTLGVIALLWIIFVTTVTTATVVDKTIDKLFIQDETCTP